MRNKIAVSYRITQVAIDIVKAKSMELGVSQADVIELAIRQFMNRIQVELDDKNSNNTLQPE